MLSWFVGTRGVGVLCVSVLNAGTNTLYLLCLCIMDSIQR
jgi:hypothetical protein